MKKWDVFVSHASEDKQAVALPLAESLIRSGLRVWLDRFELRVGDSLREKIDEGLSESEFGVVILSEQFLNKGWPKKELNGLFALEETGVKVILPIWHEIDKMTVAKYSPILADRLAVSTSEGINVVARAIAAVILEESARSRPGNLAGKLVEILEEGPSPLSVGTFLATYPKVLPAALGHFGLFPDHAIYQMRPNLGSFPPDLSVGSLQSTAGDWAWWHLFFCPIEGPFFKLGTPRGALKQAIDKSKHLERWLSTHKAEAASVLHTHEPRSHWPLDCAHMHDSLVLVGRRDRLSCPFGKRAMAGNRRHRARLRRPARRRPGHDDGSSTTTANAGSGGRHAGGVDRLDGGQCRLRGTALPPRRPGGIGHDTAATAGRVLRHRPMPSSVALSSAASVSR